MHKLKYSVLLFCRVICIRYDSCCQNYVSDWLFLILQVHLPEEDVEIIEALLNNVTGEGHTPRSIEEARLAYFRDRDSSLATDEMLQHEGELPAVGGV